MLSTLPYPLQFLAVTEHHEKKRWRIWLQKPAMQARTGRQDRDLLGPCKRLCNSATAGEEKTTCRIETKEGIQCGGEILIDGTAKDEGIHTTPSTLLHTICAATII